MRIELFKDPARPIYIVQVEDSGQIFREEIYPRREWNVDEEATHYAREIGRAFLRISDAIWRWRGAR